MKIEIKDDVFYVVKLGEQKTIAQTKDEAIKTLMDLVNATKEDVGKLSPEIIEVDTSAEKWSLKGLAWNQIAIELMRNRKP